MKPSIPKGTYVICGASGLAGYHALSMLKDVEGVYVRAVYYSRKPAIEAANITFVKADLRELNETRQVLRGADYVFAFAGVVASVPVLARDPVGPVRINEQIALNALQAAYEEKVRHLVWLSSTTGYPARDGVLVEDEMFEGEPPANWFGLGWMTRYVEKMARHYSENLSEAIPITCLRPSMIYGENDHFDDDNAHFLPAMIRRVVEREKPIEVWGTGEQERDVIHGEDVVRAALLSLERENGFAAYNIASGDSHSVNHMLRLICSNDSFDDAEIVHLTDKPQSLSKRAFSISKAQNELGFEAAVSLDEGLKRTIQWYRKQHEKGQKA